MSSAGCERLNVRKVSENRQVVECERKEKNGISNLLSNMLTLTERFSNDCHFRQAKPK